MSVTDEQVETNRDTRDEVMERIDDFPFDEVAKLFGVIEKQASVMPKMTALAGVAVIALQALDDEARDILNERAAATKRAEDEKARRDAERQAKYAREEKERADAVAAERERAMQEQAARQRAADEDAKKAEVPITSEKGSPKASPNPTQADTARRI